MFETDLQYWLQNRTAVAALVAGRIHRGVAPQSSTLPRIVWQVISDVAQQDLDGPTGERVARVQFRASATSPSGASSIANALDGELNPPGSLGGVQMGNTKILEARQVFERENQEPASDASGTTVFFTHADYLIRYAA